jgi:monovalent cation/hydrogen antiporter
MNQAEVIWTLLIVVATLAILAKKVELPYPVLLVIGGLALGFVPGLPPVQLEPDLVFLFLLPPLLLRRIQLDLDHAEARLHVRE